MINMLLYLIQVSFIFSLLYMIYKVLLSRFTFHSLNRWVLLLILPLSLIVPLTTYFLPPIEHPIEEIPQLFERIQTVTQSTISSVDIQNNKDKTIDYFTILYVIYLLGVGIGLYRFCFSLYGIYKLKKQSVIIRKSAYTVYHSSIPSAFSFLSDIFIPQHQDLNELIITHEKVHVRLRHSFDLLFLELYIIFFWWNPFVYIFRKSLKTIHEYQADHYVLSKEVKTSAYLQIIMNTLAVKEITPLYNYFNTPTLKKRVEMMTKQTSKNGLKLLYVGMLPVCMLLILAFTRPSINETTIVEDVVEMIQPTSNKEQTKRPTFIFPISSSTTKDITSSFDQKRKNPISKRLETHTGIDIKAPIGTPIIASADGTVFLSRAVGAWGNLVKIKHENGYETWYAHLKSFEAHYRQTVKQGDVIGYVGSTGNSTGPHLHYELRYQKKSINPLDYFK